MVQKHVQVDKIYQSHQLPTHLDTNMWNCSNSWKNSRNPLPEKNSHIFRYTCPMTIIFFERTQHQLNLLVSTQNMQFGCVENILRPSESKKSWRNANIFICWAESRNPIFYPVDSIFSFVNIFWYTCPETITLFSSAHNINGTYKILTIRISESVLSKKLMS